MLMDFMGGIVMINDGNVILREVMEIEIVLFYLFLLGINFFKFRRSCVFWDRVVIVLNL